MKLLKSIVNAVVATALLLGCQAFALAADTTVNQFKPQKSAAADNAAAGANVAPGNMPTPPVPGAGTPGMLPPPPSAPGAMPGQPGATTNPIKYVGKINGYVVYRSDEGYRFEKSAAPSINQPISH